MADRSKAEGLTSLLKMLESTTPDIEASAAASVDGLMMVAMSAVMLSPGERTSRELARGDLTEVCVKGEYGNVVLMASGENAVLTALARKNAKLGLIFLGLKRTAEEVGKVI